MRPNYEDQKRQHELAVATDFVVYLRGLVRQIGDFRPGVITKREPDVVCDSPDGPIGIEIADAFHSEEVAKELWSVPRGQMLFRSRGYVNAYLDLAESISRTLRAHCEKTYSTHITYLIINAVHAPQTEADDVGDVLPYLQVPEKCPFTAVYLRLRDHLTSKGVYIEVPMRSG